MVNTRNQKAASQISTSPTSLKAAVLPPKPSKGTEGETTAPHVSSPPQSKPLRVPKRVRKHMQLELVEQRRKSLRSGIMKAKLEQLGLGDNVLLEEASASEMAPSEGESIENNPNSSKTAVNDERGESASIEKQEGEEKGEKSSENEGDGKGIDDVITEEEREIAKREIANEEMEMAREAKSMEIENLDKAEEGTDVPHDSGKAQSKGETSPTPHEKEGIDEKGTKEEEPQKTTVHNPVSSPVPQSDPPLVPYDSDSDEETDSDDKPLRWCLTNLKKGKFISGSGVTIYPGNPPSTKKRLVKAHEKTQLPKKVQVTKRTRSTFTVPADGLTTFPDDPPLKESPVKKRKRGSAPKKEQGPAPGPSKKQLATKEQSSDSVPSAKSKGTVGANALLSPGKILIPSTLNLYGCYAFIELIKRQGWFELFSDVSLVLAKKDVLGFYQVCEIEKHRISGVYKGVEVALTAQEIGSILDVDASGFGKYSKLG